MKRFCIILVFFMSAIAAIIAGCGGDRPELFRAGVIAEDEFDPEVWGKIFPLQYESWLATGQMRPSGKSMYKKGWDDDKVVYDKLSEFPFLALLYNGWGFGVEYNEPRGHFFAIID
ncbi:MAG: ammonia-forming cytochrome c nitrite reductase subunit c552, partial [Spirochaetes bacterium]|nr:ammonia-forming cytochrome c nitrite reductase subunit c552 [Spirochaetota bacterium]